MRVNGIIVAIMKSEGVSLGDLAKQMGFGSGARGLEVKLHRKSGMSVTGALEILELLGYKLIVVPKDRAVDPVNEYIVEADEGKRKYTEEQ